MEEVASEVLVTPHPFEQYTAALQTLESELNKSKDKLDRPDFGRLKSKDAWENGIQYLRKEIRNKYGGQSVSKAWLKMYEMLTLPDVQNYLLAQDRITGFFNADLPGAFVFATNHFIKTKSSKDFQWVISSYLPRDDQGDFLPDMYNIIQANPNNSLVGVLDTNKGTFYSDGDLTNPKMSRILARLAKSKLGMINLYTADGGFGVEGKENLQEQLTIPLIMGEISTGLRSLSNGGIFILKMFTFFTPEMLTGIAQLAKLFDNYKLYKPITSNPINSEIYFIGIGFLGADEHIINNFESGITGETKVFTTSVSPKLRDEILGSLQTHVRKQIQQIETFLTSKLDTHRLTEPFAELDTLPKTALIQT